MKANRKNKKLKFIREKNNLRLGKRPFNLYATISEELINDSYVLESIINEMTLKGIQKLKEYFNLALRFTVLDIGYTSDNFVRNEKTIKLSLTNKQQN